MKNLFLTIFILLNLSTIANARECKSGHINGDAFIYSDGKKVKVIKGTEIPDPANKIIMIFNKGGWIVKEGQYSGECKNHIPKNLGKISGTKLRAKN